MPTPPRLLLLLALASLVPASAALAAAVPKPEPQRAFVIDGNGWGHGVGMSQWGAEGYAAHGWDYRRILAHYYRGTRLTRTADIPVRVLLAADEPALAVVSRVPFRVTDARGRTRPLEAGRHAVAPLLRVLRAPLRFRAGSQPLALGEKRYHGDLVVSGRPGSLTAVDVVPLERYLRGVVPWEMPHDWRPQALRAQAVAARSYALATLKRGEAFDVYDDTRDQVYGGIDAEKPETNRAVAATAGLVLTYRGRVAMTYYFSSSGGRTANAGDGIPWAPRVPYLVSVPDPYDSISPHHSWGPLAFRPAQLAERLDVPAVRELVPVVSPSERVAAVDVRWSGGHRVVPGRDFASALDLPSAWFRVRGARERLLKAPPGGDGTIATIVPPPPAGPRTYGDWPAGASGWTVVLASAPATGGDAAAKALAAKARADGVPGVGLLRSDDWKSLNPGYYVIFSGRYASEPAARAAAARIRGAWAGGYARRVVPGRRVSPSAGPGRSAPPAPCAAARGCAPSRR